MTEQIENSWSGQETPSNFIEQIQRLSLEVHRLKSHSIFSKLKRWMYFETALGLVACLLIGKIFAQHEHRIFLLLGLGVVAFINTYYYVQFLRKADGILRKDTRHALTESIALLKGFIRRLKWLTLGITPPLGMLIIYLKASAKGIEFFWEAPPVFIAIQIATVGVMTLVTYLFLVQSIIPKTYAKWLREWEEVHADLVSEI